VRVALSRKGIRWRFAISPVRLSLAGKNKTLVGLGSYVAERCLAGGRAFDPGPVPADITSDENGLPAGG
jgi:hypothetical protein